LSEHARDESRFAFTLHGFLNQRDVADERFRWFDFSFLFSFFTFLFAQIGVHLGVHLVHLEKRKKSEDEFFRKKAFFARENAASPALAHNIEHIL
jgi:hypothetical protein